MEVFFNKPKKESKYEKKKKNIPLKIHQINSLLSLISILNFIGASKENH
jgi:hypothetical protein